jgi:hypothetical protein
MSEEVKVVFRDCLGNDLRIGDMVGYPNNSSTARIGFAQIMGFKERKDGKHALIQDMTKVIDGQTQRGNWNSNTDRDIKWIPNPKARVRQMMVAKLVRMLNVKDKIVMLDF